MITVDNFIQLVAQLLLCEIFWSLGEGSKEVKQAKELQVKEFKKDLERSMRES